MCPAGNDEYLPRAKQGEVKGGRGGAPAWEISFVSLVAYGPKVSHSALDMSVYSFWNQAGQFPTTSFKSRAWLLNDGALLL